QLYRFKTSETNMFYNIFFFSSRRRHTRWPRDWSSDVCSSDLVPADVQIDSHTGSDEFDPERSRALDREVERVGLVALPVPKLQRSEERRVGKECRYRGVAYH